MSTDLATNLGYRFYIHPNDQVDADNLWNPHRGHAYYLIRFVFEDGVGCLRYGYYDKNYEWAEWDGRTLEKNAVKLDGLSQENFRKRIDGRLREFDLDLGTASSLLKETPEVLMEEWSKN